MPVRARTLALLLFVATGAALADDAHDHGGKAHRTITFDNQRITPDDLTMSAGEVIDFQNFSLHSMQITFIEPKDAAAKIRCGLVGMPSNDRPPWAVFDVRDGALVGIVPPGRMGSVCSLARGHYAYTVKRLDAEANPVSGELREKGQIDVR